MPLRLRSPADAIAAGIGFAPEDRKAQALLLLASVETNVTLCVPDLISRAGFLRAGAAQRIARKQADDLRIKTPHLDQLVSKLSGGNQQKVVLGRWLARRPKLLILDEPTRGIDVGAKAEIYALIRHLADNGMAILVISSEMPELIGLSDRILVMASGRDRGRSLPRRGDRRGHPGPRHDRQPGLIPGRSERLAMNAVLDKTGNDRAASRPQAPDVLGRLMRGLGTHNLSLLIALACLVAIFGGMRPDVFFSSRNIENIGQGMAILGILATAQTIVIVSGGLDISVGAVVGLSTVCIALGVQQTGSAALGILFGLVVGGIAGAVNGLIVTVGRVNAVIATLGTMAAFRGVAFIMSDGQSISIFHPLFRLIGSGRWLGLQITIEILIAVVAVFFVLMRYTVIGRNIYAIGGNPVVARLAGLNNTRLPDRRLCPQRRRGGPRRPAARGAHGVRTADLRVGRPRAPGDHGRGARGLRADGRQGHHHRRRARRHHPGRAEQRHDPDQRADLLPDGRPRPAADPRRAGRRASGQALRLNREGFGDAAQQPPDALCCRAAGRAVGPDDTG